MNPVRGNKLKIYADSSRASNGMKSSRGFAWFPLLAAIAIVFGVSGAAYWYMHQPSMPNLELDQLQRKTPPTEDQGSSVDNSSAADQSLPRSSTEKGDLAIASTPSHIASGDEIELGFYYSADSTVEGKVTFDCPASLTTKTVPDMCEKEFTGTSRFAGAEQDVYWTMQIFNRSTESQQMKIRYSVPYSLNEFDVLEDKTFTITVGGNPLAAQTTHAPVSVNVSPDFGSAPLRAVLTYTVDTGCVPYQIDWGDESKDIAGGPAAPECKDPTQPIQHVHIYQTPGSHLVVLTTAYNAKDTFVQVNDPQKASLFFINPTKNAQYTAGQTVPIRWSTMIPAGINGENYQVSFAVQPFGATTGVQIYGTPWLDFMSGLTSWTVPEGYSGQYRAEATIVEIGPTGAPVANKVLSEPFYISR